MIPDEPTLLASHETIYTALYALSRGQLRAELISVCDRPESADSPRARGEDRRGSISNRVSIHNRPAEIDERIVPDHWAGDLIKGARNASSVATLVERTLFGMILNRIDAQRRLSMTYDQGLGDGQA